MDPLADKLLVCSALICLVEIGSIPSWIAIIIIAREFAVTGLRTYITSENIIIAPAGGGKIKTVTQMIAIIAALFNISFSIYLMYIATLFTVISGVDYFVINKQVFTQSND